MPLPYKQKQIDLSTCEVCGNQFVTDYGYSLAVCWLVTGHSHIKSFMCEEALGNQHWGCTPEHALEAALVCAKEHMHPALINKHAECSEDENKPRIAVEDQHLYDTNDPECHIVKGAK